MRAKSTHGPLVAAANAGLSLAAAALTLATVVFLGWAAFADLAGLAALAAVDLAAVALAFLAAGEAGPGAIMDQMAEDSQSTVVVKERTFYYTLSRLVGENFVEAAGFGRYKLTLRGRQVLKSEQMRAGRVARLLRERV